jgi:serine/threonine protein phosphatase PrpC
MVISIPDVSIHKRSKVDKMLLIACDGVFDVFDNQEAVTCACGIDEKIDPDEIERGAIQKYFM